MQQGAIVILACYVRHKVHLHRLPISLAAFHEHFLLHFGVLQFAEQVNLPACLQRQRVGLRRTFAAETAYSGTWRECKRRQVGKACRLERGLSLAYAQARHIQVGVVGESALYQPLQLTVGKHLAPRVAVERISFSGIGRCHHAGCRLCRNFGRRQGAKAQRNTTKRATDQCITIIFHLHCFLCS